jgi:hypothetical protein
MCFFEHHLKQIELEQINLEGYKLGAAYCGKSLLKSGAFLFIKKYDYSNVDLSKYCKEQDMEACAPCGNFNSFLNGLL